MKDKVSIIVPIYNCERWLEQCIESMINQTYEKLEIILVDDGSTDRSLAICTKYAHQDARIKVIHKENAGVSAARNTGIDSATGDFITFVDSDDYLSPDIIEKAVAAADEETSLVVWNFSKIYGDKEEKNNGIFGEITDINKFRTAMISGYKDGFEAGNVRSPWGKLYPTDVLKKNNVRFLEDQYYCEDVIFLLNYLRYGKNIKLLNQYGYYYRILETSLCHKYKADLLEQAVIERSEISRLAPEYGKKDEEIAAICVSDWGKLYELYKNSRGGYKNGDVGKDEIYAASRKWYYDYLRHEKKCSKRTLMRVSTASGSLTRLQIFLGAGWPFEVHAVLMRVHFEMRNEVMSLKRGGV